MVSAQDERTTNGRRSRVLVIASVAAIVFVLVIARWLTTPFDDWVTATPHKDLPAEIKVDDLPDAAHYRCAAVLDSNTVTSTPQAVEALKHQDLTRQPCGPLRTQRTVVGGVDVAVALVVLAGLVILGRRRSTSTAVRPNATDPA